MPELDGISATRELRENPASAGVPVLLLTASVLDEDVARAREAGADGFLAKPVTLASMGRALSLHAGERRKNPSQSAFDLRTATHE